MIMTLVIGFLAFIVVFLIVRMPKLLWRFVGKGTVRVVIGTLLLVLFNVFGNQFGVYVPLNMFTVFISGLLGAFGVTSLVAVQLFILPS